MIRSIFQSQVRSMNCKVKDQPLMCKLKKKTVEVWTIDLSANDDRVQTFAETLSQPERDRAATFKFERHRQRFIKSHYALRRVLGTYCATAPAALRFIEGPSGKPTLAGGDGSRCVQFNLSHSDDRAVIAVASQDPVGIDIERIHPVPHFDAIAKRWFAPVEYDELMHVPQHKRLRAFLRLWTKKEAYIKAIGEGLVLSLDKFSIALDSDGPAPVRVVDGGIEATDWWAYPLITETDYVGAVVVRDDEWELNVQTLQL